MFLSKKERYNLRISKDGYYLKIAEAILERSTCLRRKYGTVIVLNDQIVSTGYNGSPRGEDNCIDLGHCTRELMNVPKGERYELCVAVHSEANAIISAGRNSTMGATLYIVGKDVNSGEYANPNPCVMCRRLIKNAGIERVVGFLNGEVVELDI